MSDHALEHLKTAAQLILERVLLPFFPTVVILVGVLRPEWIPRILVVAAAVLTLRLTTAVMDHWEAWEHCRSAELEDNRLRTQGQARLSEVPARRKVALPVRLARMPQDKWEVLVGAVEDLRRKEAEDRAARRASLGKDPPAPS